MKIKSGMFLLIASFALVGCGEPKPTNIAEGISNNDIEAYNKMINESEAAMAEAAESQSAFDKSGSPK